MCTLFPSSLFCAKNIFSLGVLFLIVPQSYIHTQWCSFFHCSTMLSTPCIILPSHLLVALPCNLSYFCIVTLLLHSIMILHLHIPSHFSNIIGLFFIVSTYFILNTFPSFVAFSLCVVIIILL